MSHLPPSLPCLPGTPSRANVCRRLSDSLSSAPSSVRLEFDCSHRLLIFYSNPRSLASRPCCHLGLRPDLGPHSPCWPGQLSRRVLRSRPAADAKVSVRLDGHQRFRTKQKNHTKKRKKGQTQPTIIPSLLWLFLSALQQRRPFSRGP